MPSLCLDTGCKQHCLPGNGCMTHTTSLPCPPAANLPPQTPSSSTLAHWNTHVRVGCPAPAQPSWPCTCLLFPHPHPLLPYLHSVLPFPSAPPPAAPTLQQSSTHLCVVSAWLEATLFKDCLFDQVRGYEGREAAGCHPGYRPVDQRQLQQRSSIAQVVELGAADLQGWVGCADRTGAQFRSRPTST